MRLCKFCGREIDWIFTQEQKDRPVDPEPVFVIEGEGRDHFITDDGTIIVGRDARPEEVQTKEAKINTPLGFIPHQRTCGARR